ncbi:restriction endonuclease subunit S [Acidovorax sp.]|uniref:restriction endonuclease subunit S n=1 Tax=Acidovorax sp. TaxID=1872122 RepID=UPI0025C5BD48|nr:restriction endonuclease subunit S [Acidovorax sp.]
MLLSNMELLATAPSGVAKLRELILTLAVQGKLVPQDPADEPAGVLLQKIQAEKDRLIAEGKSKRDKPLEEIAEEEKPFELPVGWEWVRLGSVMSLAYGSALPEKERLPGSIPVYGSNGIVGFHASALVSEPSLIVGRKGSVGAINISLVPFWPIDTSYFVTPPSGIELHFAFHLLRSLGLAKHDKATAIPGINRNDVYAEIVGLPPLAEQSRIVTRVEALMRLCDALEAKGQLEAAQHAQLVSTLLGTLTASTTPEELAAHWQRVAQHFDLLLDRPEAIDALEQTLLQLAVRGLLVPQDPTDEPASALLQKIRAEKDRLIATGQIKQGKPLPPITDEEKPFELPVGWEWVRINDLAEVQGGIQKTQLRTPVKQHFPYLRVANVQRDALRLEEIERFELTMEELERWRLIAGDLLIVEGNGSAEEIGRCAVWTGAIDPCVYQNHLIRVRCFQQDCMAFIKLFLNAPSGAEEMKRLAITTSGLYNLSVGKIRNYAVPMAPLAEQSRIVTRVTALRRLCADLRHRLAEREAVQARLAGALVASVA